MASNERLLKLGLLFAADMDVSHDEQPEYYSFHHKLIQEHLASRFLTNNVKQDRESFKTFFPVWWKTAKHREVVRFMVEMGADIMEQVCAVYADGVFHRGYVSNDAMSLVDELLKEAVPSSPALHITPIVSYCSKTGIHSAPIRQAMLSSHVVVVKDVQDVELLPTEPDTTEPVTLENLTKAVFIEDCKSDVVQHVMDSIQNVPLTHLYISYRSRYRGEGKDICYFTHVTLP